MQLANLTTKTDLLVTSVAEIKLELKQHVEKQESRHDIFLSAVQAMIKEIVAPMNKEIARLDEIIMNSKKETEEKIEYMRDENKQTYVTNRDFKVVWAVATAVISITGFILMLIKNS